MRPLPRAIVTATALSGTLDLLSAFAFSAVKGVGPVHVLLSVAAGPFGDPVRQAEGVVVPIAGLIVHYALMSVMASVFVLAAHMLDFVRARPLLWGLTYGLLLYLVMYWIVLPLRWPAVFPRTGVWDVGNALFAHLVCVGLPMGWVVRHFISPPFKGGEGGG